MLDKLVFRVREIAGFSPKGQEQTCVSRLLVDKETVGSQDLVLNHFTLKPGKELKPAGHPAPYDEFYYVLRGRGLLRLGDPAEEFALEPDVVAFIPRNVAHALANTGSEDLELLTGMAHQLVEGANTLYDERLRTWGTSLRLAEEV